jgi:hypothetical protein
MDRPQDPLPVARAASLADTHNECRWLLDRLWARAAVGVIGGAPKSCKSWLGLDMAVSVASGTPCLGAFAAHDQGSALIYLAEDALGVVRERLRAICRHRHVDFATLAVDVITAPSLRLDLERDQLRLCDTVAQLKPRLLLLDPFVRLHRIDENNAGEVAALLAYLRELQRQHDLAVAVVHHARKNGPTGAQAGVGLRGSSDFHAWGDSNLYLRRSRDQLTLTLEHRAAPAPEPVGVMLVADNIAETTHLEVSAGIAMGSASARVQTDDSALDGEILEALKTKAEPVARSALRAELRVRNERLGDALTRLVAAGAITRIADRWALPSAVPAPS